AEAAGDVIVQRSGRVDLLRVSGNDPPDGEDANCGDDDRQRGCDPAALAGRADHAHDERNHESRREYRADETDGLSDDISKPEPFRAQPFIGLAIRIAWHCSLPPRMRDAVDGVAQ